LKGKSHPGHQRRVKLPWDTNNPLLWLLVIVFILLLQAFVHENVHYQDSFSSKFWDLKLLTTKDALTMVIALYALTITRQQIALGLSPILVYDNHQIAASVLGKTTNPQNELVVLQCTIRNIGGGVAIFESFEFQITFSDGPDVSFNYSYPETIAVMAKHGMELNRDFFLTRFSEGGCIAADSEVVLIEMTKECVAMLKRFDLRLDFKGRLGDMYKKEIFCIPRESA